MPTPANSSIVCIDANILLRRLLGGPKYEKTRSKWLDWNKNQQTTLIAPPLFNFEVTAVVWRYVYLKQITPNEGIEALETAFEQDIQIRYPSNLHLKAWEAAQKLNLPQAYDAHYLALSQIYNCDFWTLDEKLYHTARAKFSFAHLIE